MNDVLHDYYYVHPSDVHNNAIMLRGDECIHLVKVKRCAPGAFITVVDGIGNEYTAVLQKIIDRNSAVCSIIQSRHKPNEPFVNVMLIAALIKGDRFDYIIEKAVELGVNLIVPVFSERCVRMPGGHKADRWRRIALSAMKQSHRSVLPTISEVESFLDAVNYASSINSLRIILENVSAVPLKRYLAELSLDTFIEKGRSIVAAVGPEGGFTEEEIQTAKTKSFTAVSLGTRRLRSDTAAVAAISAIMTHCEG